MVPSTLANCSIKTKKFHGSSMWISAAKWDRDTNSCLIHHKITNAHIFPNQLEKMHNYLAEEMLDNALHLMKCYRAILPDWSYLDGTIKLLEQTSSIT